MLKWTCCHIYYIKVSVFRMIIFCSLDHVEFELSKWSTLNPSLECNNENLSILNDERID